MTLSQVQQPSGAGEKERPQKQGELCSDRPVLEKKVNLLSVNLVGCVLNSFSPCLKEFINVLMCSLTFCLAMYLFKKF